MGKKKCSESPNFLAEKKSRWSARIDKATNSIFEEKMPSHALYPPNGLVVNAFIFIYKMQFCI